MLKRHNKFKAFNIHHLFIPAAINNKNRMQKQVAEKAVSSTSQSLWQGFYFFIIIIICITKYKMIVIAECIMDQMKWLYIAWHVCWGTLISDLVFFFFRLRASLSCECTTYTTYRMCHVRTLIYYIQYSCLSLTHSVLFFWC